MESQTGRPWREELVERRLAEHRVHVEHLRRGHRREVEHVVADPGADPRLLAWQHEHAVRQVVGVVRRPGRAVHPAASCGCSSTSRGRPGRRAARCTLHEPNEMNQRRAPARSPDVAPCGPGRPGRWGSVGQQRRDLRLGRAVEGLPGREQHVEEAVVLEPGFVVAVGDGVVQPGGALERRLAVEGRVDPARERRRGGNLSASSPPVRNLSRCSPSATTSAAASQAWSARPAAARRRRACPPRATPSARAASTAAVHPAGVAGQVVGVAQRDLEPVDPLAASWRTSAHLRSRRPRRSRPRRPARPR